MSGHLERSRLLTLVGIAVVLAWLFPVYWMYVSGFKTSAEIMRAPPTLFPVEPTLDAFRYVLERESLGRALGNSLVIAAGATALSLALGTAAAHALARVHAGWAALTVLAMLLVQVLPPALLATPFFIVFRQMEIINTHLAAILANATRLLPFVVIILRPVFALIPRELEDAARVDGCTRFAAFRRVTLPVARGPVLVAGALCFILAWGDFAYGLALIQSAELQPATVILYGFVGGEFADWQNVMAFSALFVTPILLPFLLLQRQIVRGLTAGAIK